jgi:hypothetical protein
MPNHYTGKKNYTILVQYARMAGCMLGAPHDSLELAPKLQWDGPLYLAVQTSLYGLFGTIGPLFDLGALFATAMLALRLRGRPAVRATSFSVAAIVLSLLVWATFVLPANMHINQWPTSATLRLDWTRWQAQWQIAQAATLSSTWRGSASCFARSFATPLRNDRLEITRRRAADRGTLPP